LAGALCSFTDFQQPRHLRDFGDLFKRLEPLEQRRNLLARQAAGPHNR